MKNIKRAHDLQKHNLDMEQFSNPGRQVIIACQMLFRENYRDSLMGRSHEVRLTEEDLMGSPKSGGTHQGGGRGANCMTRFLETRSSMIFSLAVKLFCIFLPLG